MVLFRHNKGKDKAAEADPAEPPVRVSGSEMQRLWTDGIAGRATIVETRDTGERLSGNTVLDVDLKVAREGAEPYDATMRLPVAGDDKTAYAAGAEYDVRVDPSDRTRLVFAV